MKKHFKAEVEGKVQGVGFRKATLDRAQALDLVGIVKNLENGHVYVEAFGEGKNIEELINFLQKGPALANVTKVQTEEMDQFTHARTSFEVAY